jgi:hypothetical protein
MASKKLDMDDPTLRTMAALVRQPPKPHEQMKLGKPRANRAKSPGARQQKSQVKKAGR